LCFRARLEHLFKSHFLWLGMWKLYGRHFDHYIVIRPVLLIRFSVVDNNMPKVWVFSDWNVWAPWSFSLFCELDICSRKCVIVLGIFQQVWNYMSWSSGWHLLYMRFPAATLTFSVGFSCPFSTWPLAQLSHFMTILPFYCI
jgi:hypothetical protein